MNLLGALVLLGVGPGSGGAVDHRAMAVMRENSQKMLALHSFEAICTTEITNTRHGKTRRRNEVARLIAVKPAFMRYDSWEKAPSLVGWSADKLPAAQADLTFACDGKTNYQQYGNVYRTADIKQLGTILEPWQGFYPGGEAAFALLQEYNQKGELLSAKLLARQEVDGIPCDVVTVKIKSSYNGESVSEDDTYYIGAKDHLIRRQKSHVAFGSRPGIDRNSSIHDIRLNRSFSQAVFLYKPPKGVALEAETQEQPVLPDGQQAPNFTAVTANGAKLKLADFKGKVVVVDFWASWCGPCNASMPHTQQVIHNLQSSGVPVVGLAVDDGEEQPGFQDWVKANQAKYPNLSFLFSDPHNQVSGSLYKVSGIPTQFVIDKEGVVRASFVGYGGPTNDLEQAIRSAAK